MAFKIRIDKERCKGCEYCLKVCEHAVLKMAAALNIKGRHYVEAEHPEDCVGCRKCADICPDAAIEIEKEDD